MAAKDCKESYEEKRNDKPASHSRSLKKEESTTRNHVHKFWEKY